MMTMASAAVSMCLADLRNEAQVELEVRLTGLTTVFRLRGRAEGDPARLDGWLLRVDAGGGVTRSVPLRLERFGEIEAREGALIGTGGGNSLELRPVQA